MKQLVLAAVAGLALLGAAGPASAGIVYSSNFSTLTAPGFTVTGAQGDPNPAGVITAPNGLSFIGILTQGADAQLNLTGLAPHSTVTISYDLYAIRSVDGDGTSYGPDYFSFKVDGTTVTNYTFGFPGNTQSYPVAGSPGESGAVANDPNAFGYGSYYDGALTYSFTQQLVDSAAGLTLDFIGNSNQPWNDEGFGINNVVVTTDAISAVPLPGALSMFGAALFGIGAMGAGTRKWRMAV